MELGFYAQAQVAAEGKALTKGRAGTTAHAYFEWMAQGMSKESPQSLKNGSDVYTLHTEEFRDVKGEVVGRREAESLGLDAVLYKNGTPILGLDLKTGRA